MATWWQRAWAAVTAAGLVGAAAASCNLVAGLDKIKIAGEGGAGGAVPCSADAQCDDGNPCSAGACGPDKTCVFTPIDGKPAPDAAQTAGDCKTVVCQAGQAADQTDDADVPDDHEDCTIDACHMGTPSHVPKPVSSTCVDAMGNAGRCDPQGKCVVACVTAADCAANNPCVTPSCDTTQGQCVFTPLDDGTPTPGVAPVPGDCHRRVCVMGQDVDEVDDSDVPKTATDCDEEVCTNGTPSNPAKPKHDPCSTYDGNLPGFCDGAGACVACAQDGDCPGKTTDCQHPACTNDTCGPAYTAAMTPTTSNPPQVAGDCQTIVCDGMGGTTTVYGSGDPADDGNACTTDACTAVQKTTHTALPDGTHCGTGGTLLCVGGACAGCTMNSQCAPASCNGSVLTKAQTCGSTGMCLAGTTQDCAPYACVAGASCPTKCSADTDCVSGDYCTGTNGSCVPKLPQGAACGSGHQCTTGACVDGVCCATGCGSGCMACSAAKKGGGADGVCGPIAAGTDPDNECTDQGAASCGTNGFCDGAGACQKYANGTVCLAGSCSGGTLTKAKTCVSGACTTPSPATQGCAPYVCATNACTTSCQVDTDCASGNTCIGGTCVAKLAQGSACTGANQCTSGFCVDGFCCGTACNTACQACSAAKKQSGILNGVCGASKNAAADPRNLCTTSAPSTCGNDGLCNAGACEKYPSGTTCASATCTGNTLTSASTCDGAGTCTSGMASACPGNFVCNASGTACLMQCSSDADCTPGAACTGGFCF